MLNTSSRFAVSGTSLRPVTARPSGAGVVPATHGARASGLTDGLVAKQTASTRVMANLGSSFDGASVQIANGGGITWNRFLTNLVPEEDTGLIPFYRDCYSFDSVSGATVDMQCTFTFSDYTLVGLESKHLEIFKKTCNSLNIRSLMQEVALNYLVDGAFVGSLIYDDRSNVFSDVMIHDRIDCAITEGPFFNAEPSIRVGASQKMARYVSQQTPYVKEVLARYPRQVLEAFASGAVDLDPLTTVYIPRRASMDHPSTSYLRRILPVYLLEKTMYRGTLIEAQRRMRATSLVNVGTDTWEPTEGEMHGLLQNFQMAESDPLGGWIIARQGVNVQDIRPGGDFWKWTDMIDTLVPYKLRALGVSEAFLSGEAAYATAEVAMTVFTENSAALRNLITRKFFFEKLFPLIAVTNKFYREPSKAAKGTTMAALLANLSNTDNLYQPELRWHKQLDHTDPGMFDMLEKLSEKGIPVPLKMWAAATNVSLEMLLGDLAQDEMLKKRIEEITGKPVDVSVGSDDGMGGEFASMRNLPIRPSTSLDETTRRRPLLSRTFAYRDGTPMDAPVKLSKSGKVVHSVYNEAAARRKTNVSIVAAANRLSDPSYRAQVARRIRSAAGGIPSFFDR